MTLDIREWRRARAHAWRVLALAGGIFVALAATDHAAQAQKFSQFPIATPNSVPQGITMGPDGALWFTEALGNKIGRITTAGVITEYTIPSHRAVRRGSPLGRTAPCGSQ
jgi:streptogramin lyase